MNMSTTYLGFELPHPFIVGASPLVEDMDAVRQLEDAGAAAIVMNSLFEEEVLAERAATSRSLEAGTESFGEALSFLPSSVALPLGPDEYLGRVRRVKEAVGVPVIGSLNGSSRGGWLDYARLIVEAGADALELNLYFLAADFEASGDDLERRALEMVRTVKESIQVPVAVKLSPFYSSLSSFAGKLEELNVDGLVLFNRFYQPDIDVEELEVTRSLHLSDSSELLLRLRWLAILSGRIKASLAVTGGVHTGLDAVKAIMAGADAVQMVSALLVHGPKHLRAVRDETAAWLKDHEYESLEQMRGSMNLLRSPDPSAYERANYIGILKSWRA